MTIGIKMIMATSKEEIYSDAESEDDGEQAKKMRNKTRTLRAENKTSKKSKSNEK